MTSAPAASCRQERENSRSRRNRTRAIMTEGARAINKYLKKSDKYFYGKTQALAFAYNGQLLSFYDHHALQTTAQSGLTTCEAAARSGAG
jgi:hypothetical protein